MELNTMSSPAVLCHQSLTQFLSSRGIHLQQVTGRSSNGSAADHFAADQPEVIIPGITPRMKQRNNLTVGWINRREVRAFVEIAAVAGKAQVVCMIAAAVLLRDNVLDVKR
jgi:hypothetical protein